MQDVDLFSQLLGLESPWKLEKIDTDFPNKSINLYIEYQESIKGVCPECGAQASIYDHGDLRKWRHLDTMQFATTIHCNVPRVNCKDHGIKTMKTPWSYAKSRFTAVFERFAIDVLLHAASKEDAASILKISWDEIHGIQKRAVERGLERREQVTTKHLGIDEKSFLKGHDYASILHDGESGYVLDIVRGRDGDAVAGLLKTLSDEQRKSVEAISMDMWEAFMNTANALLPNADIVHDKFHVMKYLCDAVDKVRRKENREFLASGEEVLKKTKYLWLKNKENLNEDQRWLFNQLMQCDLSVGKAWTLKESFKRFWDYISSTWAEKFFDQWFFKATHSHLEPIIKAAYTIKNHYDGIVNYIKHRITNARAEGINSKVQVLKSGARGFRNFENFRISILFNCGGLSLYP